MTDLALLTPAARPREKVPAWSLLLFTAAFIVDVIVPVDFLDALIVLASLAAGISLVMWLEKRIYVGFSKLPIVIHLMLTMTLVPAGIIGGIFSAATVAGIFDAQPSVSGILIGGMWFSSAAAGTAVMQFVDTFSRTFASRFSTRIVLTVFGLISIASVASALIVTVTPRAVAAVIEHAPDTFQIRIADDKPAMTAN